MVTVNALDVQATAKGQSLVVIPAGESVIRADQPTDVVHVVISAPPTSRLRRTTPQTTLQTTPVWHPS